MPTTTTSRLLILLALVIVIYWPSLRGGFILDDDVYLTDNRLIRSGDGLYRFWFTRDAIDYLPVTSTTLWLEWRLWGPHPTGYRVTNLALHAACAILLWMLLAKLKVPYPYLAALIFAVHPVNAQTVAWIAQRKNLLAMMFLLPSLIWYLKFDEEDAAGRWKWYALSLLACLLAMLSKGSVVVLPLLLLAVIGWRRPLRFRDAMRVLPFVAICAAVAAVNIPYQGHARAGIGFTSRLLGAGAVPWFYLFKALAPIHLVFTYPKWNIQPANWRWWIPLLATALVSALLILMPGRKIRPVRFAWFCFLIALFPVMGFQDVGYMRFTLVSDHYQHMAIIAVIALIVAAIARAGRSVSIIAPLVVAVLCLGTWKQAHIYGSARTLYESTLAVNPDSCLANNNLGLILKGEGDYPAAIDHLRRAIASCPDYEPAYNNLGTILAAMRNTGEAIDTYRKAIEINPDYAIAHANLSRALLVDGDLAGAAGQAMIAIRLNSTIALSHDTLARTNNARSDYRGAAREFRAAIDAQPGWPVPMSGLAWLLATCPDESLRDVPKALEIAADACKLTGNKDVSALDALAAAQAGSGDFAAAMNSAYQAMLLADDQHQPDLARQIAGRVAMYRNHTAYIDR